MIHLPGSVKAWNSPDFALELKRELERLAPGRLPLQQGLRATSFAIDGAIEAMLIGAFEQDGAIHARIGIFFSGITAGCSCADDPTPVEAQPEYCELALSIDKASARASVELVSD